MVCCGLFDFAFDLDFDFELGFELDCELDLAASVRFDGFARVEVGRYVCWLSGVD